jgi:exopolysaccharide biosynthesis WecB/TagA/CpsF family protein
MCAELRVPIALLGSTEPVLATAAARLEADYSGLDIVAHIAPPMGFDPDGEGAKALIDALSSSGARLCLVALGAPKQERFAAHALAALPDMGFVSVGAGLDFIAGAQTRAPRLVRVLALEWLWRMLGDPRRLAPRYAGCAAIMPTLTAGAVARRLGGRTTEPAD